VLNALAFILFGSLYFTLIDWKAFAVTLTVFYDSGSRKWALNLAKIISSII
jgi:hypothetical protein